MYGLCHGQSVRILQLFFFAAAFAVSFCVSKCDCEEIAQSAALSVHGAVNEPLNISIRELKAFPWFRINNVSMLKEKDTEGQGEKIIGVFNYKGVLLRDILERAGMTFKRKFEPLVFMRVRNSNGKEVVFSFGEVFYSSIGRSILIAYEKDGKPIEFAEGCGELIVTTDVREGRRIPDVNEIVVERVDIKLHAYEDKKHHIVRPPSEEFVLVDQTSGSGRSITPKDLERLPSVLIPHAVMTGDCEGFNGVFSFEGPCLRTVLEKFATGYSVKDYQQYVVISSEDGFSAVFSFGEIFNSRLDNNIIIATKKNGKMLGPKDGFAMSIVGEDSTGGRSVKRIRKIEIF